MFDITNNKKGIKFDLLSFKIKYIIFKLSL